MARQLISKKDLNKREKLAKQIEEAQKQMEEIEENVKYSIGTFVCEKFESFDPQYLEEQINFLYDLSQTEEAAKGQIVQNEDNAEYITNVSPADFS